MAEMGTAATLPGVLEIYDVKTDCRHPKRLSTTLSSLFGHESGLCRDGKTFYASGTAAGLRRHRHLRPAPPEDDLHQAQRPVPRPAALRRRQDAVRRAHRRARAARHHRRRAADPGRQRHPGAQVEPEGQGPLRPEVAERLDPAGGRAVHPGRPPVRPRGRRVRGPVLRRGLSDLKQSPVGAARIINVDDPRHPRVVSNIRLAVHQPDAHSGRAEGGPGGLVPGPGVRRALLQHADARQPEDRRLLDDPVRAAALRHQRRATPARGRLLQQAGQSRRS